MKADSEQGAGQRPNAQTSGGSGAASVGKEGQTGRTGLRPLRKPFRGMEGQLQAHLADGRHADVAQIQWINSL